MVIEKYGKVEVSDDGIRVSEFIFNCKGKGFDFITAMRRSLYFARGVINRELKVLEDKYQDYNPQQGGDTYARKRLW